MAHQLDTSNNRYNMAYRGEKGWHGFGTPIEPGDTPEEIAVKAGLTFTLKKGAIQFQDEAGNWLDGADLAHSVIYRDDTMAPLSIQSTDRFHIVQPRDLTDFVGNIADVMGWPIETAGSLKGGRKFWALLNIGEEATIGRGDVVKGYLLAASACDGTMASEFKFTVTRVVCNNTLEMAIGSNGGGGGRSTAVAGDGSGPRPSVRVTHSNRLDVDEVKGQLGIAPTVWARFIEQAKHLASVKVSERRAVKLLRDVYEKDDEIAQAKLVEGQRITDEEFFKSHWSARRVMKLYDGTDPMPGAVPGTAWGLLNAGTFFYDHETMARSEDTRLNSAWFGVGARKKQAILDACMAI